MSIDEFEQVWNESATLGEAVERIGKGRQYAVRRAMQIRRHGIPLKKFSPRHMCPGDNDGYAPTKLPDPTDALPGTAEKVEVLRQRFSRNEILWSDEDALFSWSVA